MIVHDCEQNSEDWFSLRAGIPTASNFSKLVTSTGEISKTLSSYALTLAAEKFSGGKVDAWDGNYHTERGKDLEEEALASYKLIYEADITRVGFVTNDSGSIGCSPDALVGEYGMAEVKCLKAENHIETVLYYNKHKKAPPKYFQQTQGQLMICGREWNDLIFYHPVLPMLVIRETPDLNFQTALMLAVDDVYKECSLAIIALESI